MLRAELEAQRTARAAAEAAAHRERQRRELTDAAAYAARLKASTERPNARHHAHAFWQYRHCLAASPTPN